MLRLKRKPGEALWIGDAWVIVIGIEGDRVELGIEAPKTTTIAREEVANRVHKPKGQDHEPRR